MAQPAAPAPWYSIRKPSPETAAAQGFVSAAEIFIYGAHSETSGQNASTTPPAGAADPNASGGPDVNAGV